ncbi:MAG: desulfoferrodoxin family protein [bacterium]
MKGLVCKVCGYVAIDGTAPDNCSVCHAPKTSFEDKDDALKTPQDPKNLTELEKKHVPVITVVKKCGLIPEGCQDVHIKVGEITHPMLKEHFIMYIDVYLDKRFASRITLSPEVLNPAAALHVKAEGVKLTAVERCNIHGAWISEADL